MAKFTAYPNKAKPADSDTLLINDASASANKQILLSGLFAWLRDKFTSTPINGLETTNQTIVGAINELHDAVEEGGSASEIEQIRSDVDDLKADLEDLDDRVEALESGSGGSGLTDTVKTALMNLVSHLAWDDDDPTGQTYITALQNALYPPAPPASLTSITAVYTQSGTVYDTDVLNSLKSDLVVTASYSGGSTSVVPSSDYTLSGALTEGTSTITVSYGGKTATFYVTVTSIMETVSITWTGSGADKTSSMIDATNADVYWTFPYIEGFSGYSSDTTRESNFVKLQAYLYSDSEGTTPVGRYHIDNEIIETSGRTTAKRPWMPVDAQVKVAPHGYYVKLMASKSGTGFSSNANCETFLNTYANTVKLMGTSGG